jgi:PelA/Pel-15E family pectate lyase
MRNGLLGCALALGAACSGGARPAGTTDGGGSTGDDRVAISVPDAATNDKAGPAPDAPVGGDAAGSTVPWTAINKQPAAWYASAAAAQIASNIIYYQNDDGGWPKNIDMTTRAAPKDESIIDNGATTTQLIFLGKVYAATSDATVNQSFLKGLDYLLAAQYANGGWPQVYPNATGYHTHITFNDGAMIHVVNLLRQIGARTAPYMFVDADRAAKCLTAVQKAIDCILKCQIVINGQKTGWCAQHDEVTFAPAKARAYELASESGQEGAGVLEFLMSLEAPTPEIVDAVQSATRWFKSVQITGIKVQKITDATQASGVDVVVVADPAAPPLWARFYELGTNRPFFCDRDGIVKYTLAEIGNERRTGYSWYGDEPANAFKTYATWQPKWAPDTNVLAP